MTTDEQKPIVWRGVTLAPHGRWMWLSADRLWKVTNIGGEGHWVAYLQLEIEITLADSATTAESALEALVVQASQVAEKLNGALRQAEETLTLAQICDQLESTLERAEGPDEDAWTFEPHLSRLVTMGSRKQDEPGWERFLALRERILGP